MANLDMEIPFVLCKNAECQQRFKSIAGHQLCLVHAPCLSSGILFNPEACPVCAPIIISMKDESNVDKWPIAQPLISWVGLAKRFLFKKFNRQLCLQEHDKLLLQRYDYQRINDRLAAAVRSSKDRNAKKKQRKLANPRVIPPLTPTLPIPLVPIREGMTSHTSELPLREGQITTSTNVMSTLTSLQLRASPGWSQVTDSPITPGQRIHSVTRDLDMSTTFIDSTQVSEQHSIYDNLASIGDGNNFVDLGNDIDVNLSDYVDDSVVEINTPQRGAGIMRMTVAQQIEKSFLELVEDSLDNDNLGNQPIVAPTTQLPPDMPALEFTPLEQEHVFVPPKRIVTGGGATPLTFAKANYSNPVVCSTPFNINRRMTLEEFLGDNTVDDPIDNTIDQSIPSQQPTPRQTRNKHIRPAQLHMGPTEGIPSTSRALNVIPPRQYAPQGIRHHHTQCLGQNAGQQVGGGLVPVVPPSYRPTVVQNPGSGAPPLHEDGGWTRMPSDAEAIMRGGKWVGIKFANSDTIREGQYGFFCDTNKVFWYRASCFIEEDDCPTEERYFSSSMKFKKAFTRIATGISKTGFGVQKANPDSHRSTVNQWIEFSQKNPWLHAGEFNDLTIWQSFLETSKLPQDSDVPFLRTFLKAGDMDFHKCLSAPILVQKDLLRISHRFTVFPAKLAEDDFRARSRLMTALEMVSALFLTSDSFIRSLKNDVKDPKAKKTLASFAESMGCLANLPVFFLREVLSDFFVARAALRRACLGVFADSLQKHQLLRSDPFSAGLFPAPTWREIELRAAAVQRTLDQVLSLAPRRQGKKRQAGPQGGGPSKKSYRGRGRGHNAQRGGQQQQQQRGQTSVGSGQSGQSNQEQTFRGRGRMRKSKGQRKSARGGSGNTGGSGFQPAPKSAPKQ